ncbi:MAG: tRNA(Ile2)-agmatinylcytidine synthase [Candidatus Argoarchaeum ethanivorans]|uniref:tRNA(Ile2) 2-agmatinylcytidine synthetase TiaS n=1 Tax=Candidatus Argoarchaeum ethanivorans TaxID=2608793 RepID=A0A8B3S0X8_9EURY|nr:MAG: tRNA(Ile2)-agmatinylcytidine synthase [Candidatus Argoarchaeum ethanivorans]
MIIGIDDTDSKTAGMCTTYLGALVVERISALVQSTVPYLLRLNPNVRFKTRGNAAVAFDVVLDKREMEKVKQICCNLIEEFAVFSDRNTHPGIVFLTKEQAFGIRSRLEDFSLRAVRDFITIAEAKNFLGECHIAHVGYKNGRGLIGALAAAGFVFNGLPDYTYELIAYRKPGNWEKKRFLVDKSVWAADSMSYPHTWDTVDCNNCRIVCSPHGPDPVLFGIRGDDVNVIEHASNIIQSEPIENRLMYITNQGTDMHITDSSVAEARDGRSYRIKGMVEAPPQTISGGHVIFTIKDSTGRIDCAAFEPTKNFRGLIKQLAVGDIVTVYGSIKNKTVNIEKIDIGQLQPRVTMRNPVCSACGKRMKSAGMGQGYRCKKCKTTSSIPERLEAASQLVSGLYETPPVARRHLAKPLIRYTDEMVVHPSR